MTDQEMATTLFVSDEGEIRELPEFAGKEQVTYQIPKKPLWFPIDPADAMKPVEYSTQVWRAVWLLPECAEKAIVRLYREREEARELAIDWYWQFYLGAGFSAAQTSAQIYSLVDRCWQTPWIRESEPLKRP